MHCSETSAEATERKLAAVAEDRQRKHEVLAELREEHGQLKTELGEPGPAPGFPRIPATPSSMA
jgi:hypothetical protein